MAVRETLHVREAIVSDLSDLLAVEREAFGDNEGPEIVELVNGLLADPTAKPLLSLVAIDDNCLVGHILFTNAQLKGAEQVTVSLLAPLAVAPAVQNQGVGRRLIEEGLLLLAAAGVQMVFVLGHPGYYPRYGFAPAGKSGFDAPYPIPEEVADAWMVRELSPGLIGTVRGKVACAKFLDQPEYWRE